MHCAGNREDSRRSAIELPPPKRNWRRRCIAIAGAVFSLAPFVIAAGDPAGAPDTVSTARTDVGGQLSASVNRSSGAAAQINDGSNPGDAPQKNEGKISVEAGELPNGAPYINSLGMEFVRIPGTKVRFSRWDTRVSDWQAFIQEEGDTAQWGLYALDEKEGAWVMKEDLSWKNPGFEQTGQHPVVGVSWEDARRFCAWLSRKEGRKYRLPTDSEWSAASGTQKYPWGDEFPPPAGAGNYCGGEAKLKTDGGGAGGLSTIDGYDDGFPRTSPVGSFLPNRYGLYDMGGNVWQWCEDKYKAWMNSAEALRKVPALKEEKTSDGTPCRVLRGASWRNSHEMGLRSASRDLFDPRSRYDHNGFRCVLVIPNDELPPKVSAQVEVARNVPPATPMPQKAPKAIKTIALENPVFKELKAQRKQLKEEQAKVEATLNHLLEWYGKGVTDEEVAGYNVQVRQAWAERDQVSAQLLDVETNLRTHGGKQ
jgi:formylglycine-generating enzyme required for sulfatase activity